MRVKVCMRGRRKKREREKMREREIERRVGMKKDKE